jgi:RNA polymerase sigma-70 factor, ECF subfamily
MAFKQHATAASNRCGAGVPQLPDTLLIELIVDGDKDAFGTLYLRHHDYVLRVIMRHLNNVAMAEEVVNEVFLEVWRTAKHFAAKSQVTTWLMGIARHRAISATRRRSEEPLDDRAAAGLEDEADDALICVQKRERSDILQKCLQQLPQTQREVIDLIYYQDKSVGEAARSIGIPAATVRTRMFYARGRIADLLQREGIDHSYI